MTRWAVTFVGAAILALTLSSVASAVVDKDGKTPKPHIIEGMVTIQFEDSVTIPPPSKGFGQVSFSLSSLDAILSDFRVSEARKIFPWAKERPKANSGRSDLTRFYELDFPTDIPVQQVIYALQQNPNIRLAEPVWALPIEATPNDPEFSNSSEWAYAPPGPDPYFYDAWDYETGSDSIKYGAIDSGVNYKHPDLRDNIWVNPGEDLDSDRAVYDTDDLNGIDDDGNGIVDDLIGYDFYQGTSQGTYPGEDGGTPDTDPLDRNGHGTHISGIAAAENNNGIDVNGAAGGWFGGNRARRGVQIVCIRVGGTGADGQGWINSNNAGQGLSYAAHNGCKVVNCSWGSSDTAPMIAGMNDCAAYGVTVCHAAGNDDDEIGDWLDTDPATTVLSVASVTSTDQKSSFSNYGYWIDVSAPGSGIYNTYSTSTGAPTLGNLSGTSMASPMVAGEALLIRSMMPSLTKAQVDSLIINTTDNIDALNSNYVAKLGTGRINAATALSVLANAKFDADVTFGEAPLTVQFTDLSPNTPVAWDWTFGDGNVSTDQNPMNTYADPGLYDVSLIIDENNPLGPGEEHLRRFIWVTADTLKVDTIEYSAGTQVEVPLYLANTSQIKEMQFTFKIYGTPTLDSLSVESTRASYFNSVTQTAFDPFNNRYSWLLKSSAADESHYLHSDTGLVMRLLLSIPSGTADTILIDTTTFSSRSSYMRSINGDYWPVFSPIVLIPVSCAHGDFNCDGSIDISDLTGLVNYAFKGGPLIEFRGADVNGDGSLDVSDVTYLVNYSFKGGPPPPV